VRSALGRGVAVVVATQVYYGGAQAIYGDTGGGLTLSRAGAVQARRLTAAKASLLLGLGLGNGMDPRRPAELLRRASHTLEQSG
jgi:L-asparaginase/Glu-tRNA(Gln) amidotransferase subunit D